MVKLIKKSILPNVGSQSGEATQMNTESGRQQFPTRCALQMEFAFDGMVPAISVENAKRFRVLSCGMQREVAKRER